MPDAFVSYSRKLDTALVDRLQAALAARGIECWVDREGIFPSSPWRAEIERAIMEADSVVFVLSPESVESPYCQAELRRAVALQKRLLPVLAREVPAGSVPPELAELQFISFTDAVAGAQAGFERQVT